MNRMRAILVAAIVMAASPVFSPAGDEKKASDPIGDKLAEAKKGYLSKLKLAREPILKKLDVEDEKARDAGNLEFVKQLTKERQTLEMSGEPPARHASKEYRKERDAAADALTKAYKEAKLAYLKARKDNDANRVDAELTAFAKRRASGGSAIPEDAQQLGPYLYKAFDKPLTWHEARQACANMGGRLAVVQSDEENRFLLRLIVKSEIREAWLGATDEVAEGQWFWVDGSPMTYGAWDRGQPNNRGAFGDTEHYLMMRATRDGAWWDLRADGENWQRGFVCQWAAPTRKRGR